MTDGMGDKGEEKVDGFLTVGRDFVSVKGQALTL